MNITYKEFFTFCLVAALSSPFAYGQADLSFFGGNGTPLVLTLNAPITYTINATTNMEAPGFIFQGVGNVFGDTYPTVSGMVTFSINGGTPETIDFANSGFVPSPGAGTALAISDLYLFDSNYLVSNLTTGDVVTLSAGTLTTTTNVASFRPTGGAYPSYLFDVNENVISGAGVSAAPEPSAWALAFVAGGLFFYLRRRQASTA